MQPMGTVALALYVMAIIPSDGQAGNEFQQNTPPSVTSDHSRELVVLIHGFGRTSRDMKFPRSYFSEQGYAVFSHTLPAFFRSVEDCARVLEKKLAGIDLSSYDRVHFVGHSMGGLIIRQFLAEHIVPNVGRCVLIGPPSQGTPLGAIARNYLPPLTWISPAYVSFQPGGKPIPPPLNDSPPEFGVIAGTGDGLYLGKFIDGPNDGRVPLNSVPFPGMKEMIVLPYHHDEIHKKRDTAEAIKRFLEEGKF